MAQGLPRDWRGLLQVRHELPPLLSSCRVLCPLVSCVWVEVLLLVAKEQRASCWCCLVCVAGALGGTTPPPVQLPAVPGVGLVAGRQRSVLPRRMESVRLGTCGNGVGRLCCSRPSLVRIGSCRVPMCGFHAVCMLVSAASFGAKRGRV